MTTQTPAPIGTVINAKNAGAVRIEIVSALGGFTVNTRLMAESVPGWCGSYPTLNQARDAANHARTAFRAYRTVERINARRNQLAIQRAPIADRQARSHTPWIYGEQLDAIDTEMAALEDLSTRAQRAQFIDAVTEFLTEAA